MAVLIENMKKDVELIERIVYKSADDIAVSFARAFERREERVDAAESRIYSRLCDIEDGVKADVKALHDIMEDSGAHSKA